MCDLVTDPRDVVPEAFLALEGVSRLARNSDCSVYATEIAGMLDLICDKMRPAVIRLHEFQPKVKDS